MAQKIKAGDWYFCINPSDPKELQRSGCANGQFCKVCSLDSEIFDIEAKGSDVLMHAAKGDYIRRSSGIVEKC